MARKKQERRNSPLLMVVVLRHAGAVLPLGRRARAHPAHPHDGANDGRWPHRDRPALRHADARVLAGEERADVRPWLTSSTPESCAPTTTGRCASNWSNDAGGDGQPGAGRARRLPGVDPRFVALARPAQPPLGAEPDRGRAGDDPAAADRRAGALRRHADRHRGLGRRGPLAGLARQGRGLDRRCRHAPARMPNFQWSHPSTAYASGLLATLAEFYAGAGVQRGLTAEMVEDPKTLDFVSEIEKTVQYYGEAEAGGDRAGGAGRPDLPGCLRRLRAAGDGVQQRRLRQPPAKLVALYPAEGTLWADHPLALLETPT